MKDESQFCWSFLEICERFLKFSGNSLEIVRVNIWSKYKLFFLLSSSTFRQNKVNFSKKLSNKEFFYGNFLTKHIFVEIFPQSILLWKFYDKSDFCGNISTEQLFLNILQQSKCFWKFSGNSNFWEFFQQNKCWWKFSHKAYLLRKFSNKAIFCGNFPKKQVFVEIFKKIIFVVEVF